MYVKLDCASCIYSPYKQLTLITKCYQKFDKLLGGHNILNCNPCLFTTAVQPEGNVLICHFTTHRLCFESDNNILTVRDRAFFACCWAAADGSEAGVAAEMGSLVTGVVILTVGVAGACGCMGVCGATGLGCIGVTGALILGVGWRGAEWVIGPVVWIELEAKFVVPPKSRA